MYKKDFVFTNYDMLIDEINHKENCPQNIIEFFNKNDLTEAKLKKYPEEKFKSIMLEYLDEKVVEYLNDYHIKRKNIINIRYEYNKYDYYVYIIYYDEDDKRRS